MLPRNTERNTKCYAYEIPSEMLALWWARKQAEQKKSEKKEKDAR